MKAGGRDDRVMADGTLSEYPKPGEQGLAPVHLSAPAGRGPHDDHQRSDEAPPPVKRDRGVGRQSDQSDIVDRAGHTVAGRGARPRYLSTGRFDPDDREDPRSAVWRRRRWLAVAPPIPHGTSARTSTSERVLHSGSHHEPVFHGRRKDVSPSASSSPRARTRASLRATAKVSWTRGWRSNRSSSAGHAVVARPHRSRGGLRHQTGQGTFDW